MNIDVPKSVVGPGGQSKAWGTSLVNIREEQGCQDLSECQREARTLGVCQDLSECQRRRA